MAEENNLPLTFLEKVIYQLFTKDIFNNGYTSCEDHNVQLIPYKRITNEGWQLDGRCPKCNQESQILAEPNKIVSQTPMLAYFAGNTHYVRVAPDDL